MSELLIWRLLCPLLLGLLLFFALKEHEEPQFETNESFFEQQSPAASADRQALMHMMWTTPILHVNLFRALNNPASPLQQINPELVKTILRTYREFEHNTSQAVGASSSTATLNDRFFYFQANGGWDQMMSNSPRMSWLYRWWQDMADQFLELVGTPEQDIRDRDRSTANLHAWASISNTETSFHAIHTHPDSLISGVYYVSVPPGAGKIIFHDPRGPFVPFENTFEITPAEGDLVLFPAWLPHTVSPSRLSDVPRISIAFNLPGAWVTTAAVGTQIPLYSSE